MSKYKKGDYIYYDDKIQYITKVSNGTYNYLMDNYRNTMIEYDFPIDRFDAEPKRVMTKLEKVLLSERIEQIENYEV